MRADKKQIERLLKTARGQIDGVLKMIDENQYCMDIINQILASNAILKKANKEILKAHIEGCVVDSFEAESESAKKAKIAELEDLLDKAMK